MRVNRRVETAVTRWEALRWPQRARVLAVVAAVAAAAFWRPTTTTAAVVGILAWRHPPTQNRMRSTGRFLRSVYLGVMKVARRHRTERNGDIIFHDTLLWHAAARLAGAAALFCAATYLLDRYAHTPIPRIMQIPAAVAALAFYGGFRPFRKPQPEPQWHDKDLLDESF